MTTLRFAGGTNRGRCREHNEDAYSMCHSARGGFVVADGMGGHAGGAVASQLAVESIDDSFSVILADISGDTEPHYIQTSILNAMGKANTIIRHKAANDSTLNGMGCTLLTAIVHASYVTIGHVGDCRAYQWRTGTIKQLTTDHTVIANMVAQGIVTPDQARHSPYHHVLNRAIGITKELSADVQTVNIQPEDRLLLCSDGLWNMLNDDQLSTILSTIKVSESCAAHLINEANRMGGKDNITVIVIDILYGEQV